jgi:hypothetical protein
MLKGTGERSRSSDAQGATEAFKPRATCRFRCFHTQAIGAVELTEAEQFLSFFN